MATRREQHQGKIEPLMRPELEEMQENAGRKALNTVTLGLKYQLV
jgi:hypothetical protein